MRFCIDLKRRELAKETRMEQTLWRHGVGGGYERIPAINNNVIKGTAENNKISNFYFFNKK